MLPPDGMDLFHPPMPDGISEKPLRLVISCWRPQVIPQKKSFPAELAASIFLTETETQLARELALLLASHKENPSFFPTVKRDTLVGIVAACFALQQSHVASCAEGGPEC